MLCTALFAQIYRCDWSVVGQGGGDMTSTSFRAGTTVGQTAIGLTASTAYQAFIGFWQIDTAASGIQEKTYWSQTEPLVTMLYAPFPNPARAHAQVHYSLATESHVSLRVYDLTGKLVTNLLGEIRKPGRYTISLPASHLSRGLYFLKMKAGDYQATKKLVVQ